MKVAIAVWGRRTVDIAVLNVYGRSHDMGDEEILEQLPALNLERAGKQ